jgi:hypothetical protein
MKEYSVEQYMLSDCVALREYADSFQLELTWRLLFIEESKEPFTREQSDAIFKLREELCRKANSGLH